MLSGNFPTIKLNAMCTQEDAAGFDGMGLSTSGGQVSVKKRELTKKVTTVDGFLAALRMLLKSMVYIAVAHIATLKDWPGEVEVGMVAGKRRQFSRAGLEVYYDFWFKVAKYYKGNKYIDHLVMQEFNARDSWKDKFAQKMSLESCMLWSLARYSGEIYARLPQNKEKLEQGFRSPGGGTGLIHKRQREDDRAGLTPKTLSRYERAQKMPDFDKDIRTTRALANGNPICVGFNIRKGCTFNGCKHMHVCDVKLENGQACGQNHPRFEHKEKYTP